MDLYAIVDIETTGGNASGSRITEIAILIHDGRKVIQRWETLVNPLKDIPAPIFALTGIDNAMVREAPVFDDVAPTIFEMLSDKIFVAHNVNFDYSFVRHELESAGFKWSAKKLCTVRAARKIRPGLASYSLGNLCRCLDIPLANRHRAGGDADATAELFSRLWQWDQQHIEAMVRKSSPEQRLPPNLPQEDFDRLPEKPGVYYFHDRTGKVVYVGKAVNIKKRVASHFTGHNIRPQRQSFLRDIHSITFEVCATEFMALLLECSQIRKLWPAHNRALKRFEPKFGLFGYEARSGYRYLAVGRLARFQNCIQTFSSEHEGFNALRDLATRFGIDMRFCQFGRPDASEFIAVKNTSELPELVHHNNLVSQALEHLERERPAFAIIDKGRTEQEHSCVWVEKGCFHGMGYIPASEGFTEPTAMRDYLTPYASNHYVMQLIQGFAARNPQKVVKI